MFVVRGGMCAAGEAGARKQATQSIGIGGASSSSSSSSSAAAAAASKQPRMKLSKNS
jgi:hypothetical protein